MSSEAPGLDRFYVTVVIALMLVFPATSVGIELAVRGGGLVDTCFTWFVFWAIGMRLATAGLRQILKPELTARNIFHATSTDSFVIVRELGYSNICLGSLGLASIALPGWRLAAAATGGLYFALAGLLHVIKKPAGPNEVVAMVSDLWVAGLLLVLFLL